MFAFHCATRATQGSHWTPTRWDLRPLRAERPRLEALGATRSAWTESTNDFLQGKWRQVWRGCIEAPQFLEGEGWACWARIRRVGATKTTI